jgi:hypothetical protein
MTIDLDEYPAVNAVLSQATTWDQLQSYLSTMDTIQRDKQKKSDTRRKLMLDIAEGFRVRCPSLRGGAFWTKDKTCFHATARRFQWRVEDVQGQERKEVVLLDEWPLRVSWGFTRGNTSL